MGLVQIRHGVARHTIESRVRAYKNRAKGTGWQVNRWEHFCHSLTLKTSFFPLSIRLLFGAISGPKIEKEHLLLSWTLTRTRSWCKYLWMRLARMVKFRIERRPSATIDCSLGEHSYYQLFELVLWVMVRRKNDCTVILRRIYPFFLFSMTFFGSS